MSLMKILASLTLPINSMVAFWLEGGGLEWCLLAGAWHLHWHRLCAWPGCWGRSCCVFLPSGSLKASSFECSDTHDAYAPTLDNYSTESGFGHFPFWSGFGCFWPCITILTAALLLGPLTTGAGSAWLFLLWPLLEPCCWVFFLSTLWAPLTAAISCLLHFDPLWPGLLHRSLGVWVVISGLVRQCITDYT